VRHPLRPLPRTSGFAREVLIPGAAAWWGRGGSVSERVHHQLFDDPDGSVTPRAIAGVTRSISWTRQKPLLRHVFRLRAAAGFDPRYDLSVFRFDKFRFNDQLTQFLQEAVYFTVVVAVVEALLIVVGFVLASR